MRKKKGEKRPNIDKEKRKREKRKKVVNRLLVIRLVQ